MGVSQRTHGEAWPQRATLKVSLQHREVTEESFMPQEVQVGTILISEWPQPFGLETELYSGRWSVAMGLDGFAVDRKIRAAGWNFFFIASEVKGIVTKTFLGLPYATLSAHPRHVQENCYLDGPEARRSLMSGQNVMLPSRILRQTSREKGASLPSAAD